MEGPAPIFMQETIETPIENEKDLHFNEKQYLIKINNLEYKLIILYNESKIIFQIDNEQKLLLYNYKKIYLFKELISIFSLPLEIYEESTKIIELIDKAFNNDKLKLKFDDKNNNILLTIKIKNWSVNKENDYTIKINKNDYKINEKFDIIIKELELLKQNNESLFTIEKKIISLKNEINNKLKENQILIDSLQEKIKNNKKQLENNEYQINLLKSEISSLKNISKNKKESKEKSKRYNKKDEKKEKEKNIKKHDIEDKIIGGVGVKTKVAKTIYSSNKNIKEVKLNDFKNLKIKCQNEEVKYSEVIVEYLPTHEIYLMKIYNKNFLKDHNLTLLKKSELDKLNYPFLCNLIVCFKEKDNIYFVETLLLENFFDNYKLPKNDEDKARFYIAQIALTIE